MKGVALSIIAILVITISAQARNCSVSKQFEIKKSQVLSGALLDPAGAVVPGLRMELLSGKKVVHSVSTDSLGQYDFGNVQAGRYKIRIRYENDFCAPKVVCDGNGCVVRPTLTINPKSMVQVD